MSENDTDATQAEAQESQEQPQEQAGPQESAPEEVEAQAEGEEPASEEPAPAPEAEEPAEKHKRAGGWRRKIEHLERQNQILAEELAKKELTPDEKAAEYVNRLVQQELAKREEQNRYQQIQADFQRRMAEERARLPDFDDVLDSARIPVSPDLQRVLLTSEQGPAIMYQLAKNPAELARISALPPLDAAREIGRLEARASSTASPKPAAKTATRPPAPPTTVGGSTSSTRRLEDLPLSEYKKAVRSGRR